MPFDVAFRYFFTRQDIICYFSDYITIKEIREDLQRKKNEVQYRFEKVPLPLIEVGKHTSAVNPRDIN